MSLSHFQFNIFLQSLMEVYGLTESHIVPENKHGYVNVIVRGDTPEDLIEIRFSVPSTLSPSWYDNLDSGKTAIKKLIDTHVLHNYFGSSLEPENSAYNRLYNIKVLHENKSHKIIEVRNKADDSIIVAEYFMQYNKRYKTWERKDGKSIPFQKLKGTYVKKEIVKTKLSLKWEARHAEPSISAEGVITLSHGKDGNVLSFCEIEEQTDTRVVFNFYRFSLTMRSETRQDSVSSYGLKYIVELDNVVKRQKEKLELPVWAKVISSRLDFERNPLNENLHHILDKAPKYEGHHFYVTYSNEYYMRLGSDWCPVSAWWLEKHITQYPKEVQDEYGRIDLVINLMK